MATRTAISALLLLSLLSTPSLASDQAAWDVSDLPFGVRYVANGQKIHGHQFGFVKLRPKCETDLLWLALSSADAQLQSLDKGSTATFRIQSKHGQTDFTAKLIQVGDIGGFLYIAVFSNVTLSTPLLELITQSETVSVKVVSPSQIASVFDWGEEFFDVAGFSEYRSLAQGMCRESHPGDR